MRPAIALVLLAACSDLPIDAGLDAALIAECDPGATEPPAADGDGTPPTGTYPVAWSCISGCVTEGLPVLSKATHVTIDVTTRENGTREGVATWSIAGDPLYPISMFEENGCWFRHAPFGACQSAWFLCDRLGRVSIAHMAFRDPVTGTEQIWAMQ